MFFKWHKDANLTTVHQFVIGHNSTNDSNCCKSALNFSQNHWRAKFWIIAPNFRRIIKNWCRWISENDKSQIVRRKCAKMFGRLNYHAASLRDNLFTILSIASRRQHSSNLLCVSLCFVVTQSHSNFYVGFW